MRPAVLLAWVAAVAAPASTETRPNPVDGVANTVGTVFESTTTPALLLSETTQTPTTTGDAADSDSPAPTGGAIPQPMQGSVAGLLGFVIVGLVVV